MGYEHINPQELEYNGEVNTEWVIHTAVDLVLLHTDLELINGLVVGAKQENYKNVILYDILNARSEPNDVLTKTLGKSVSSSFRRIAQRYVMAQPPVIPPRAVQQLEVSSDSTNTRRSSAPHVQSNLSSQQPPSSPLLQQQGRQPEQQYTSLPSPNSEEDFSDSASSFDPTSAPSGLDETRNEAVELGKYTYFVYSCH